MAVPSTIEDPVPFGFVFAHGVLGLWVEPVTGFGKRGAGD